MSLKESLRAGKDTGVGEGRPTTPSDGCEGNEEHTVAYRVRVYGELGEKIDYSSASIPTNYDRIEIGRDGNVIFLAVFFEECVGTWDNRLPMLNSDGHVKIYR